jgi:hypothetical protein
VAWPHPKTQAARLIVVTSAHILQLNLYQAHLLLPLEIAPQGPLDRKPIVIAKAVVHVGFVQAKFSQSDIPHAFKP